MKASELITLLQDAIDKYGDLPVIQYDQFLYEVTEFRLVPLDHKNYGPLHLKFGPPVKFWLDT